MHRTVVAQHTYLGDVDDLTTYGGPDAPTALAPDSIYTLPLLPLDDVVLCPGEILPLRLLYLTDRASVQCALAAEPPLRRLIAVICCKRAHTHGIMSFERIGCIAEVIKMSADQSSVLARGRQRFELVLDSASGANIALRQMKVRILRDEVPTSVPQPAVLGAAAWPASVYARYDPVLLAKQVRKLVHAVAPNAPEFQGDALQLSFWLISNLPLSTTQRQRMLECLTVQDRLIEGIKVMSKLSKLYCYCGHCVASSVDICQMNEEGISSIFVNSHAVVHDIVTVSKVEDLHVEGDLVTEHSWFPAYGWRIAYCPNCESHLGWKFECTDSEMQPRTFYGLRRSSITSEEEEAHEGFEQQVNEMTDDNDSDAWSE